MHPRRIAWEITQLLTAATISVVFRVQQVPIEAAIIIAIPMLVVSTIQSFRGTLI